MIHPSTIIIHEVTGSQEGETLSMSIMIGPVYLINRTPVVVNLIVSLHEIYCDPGQKKVKGGLLAYLRKMSTKPSGSRSGSPASGCILRIRCCVWWAMRTRCFIWCILRIRCCVWCILSIRCRVRLRQASWMGGWLRPDSRLAFQRQVRQTHRMH